MKLLCSILVATLLILSNSVCNAEFYRYYDDNGVVNITNDFKSIPKRYRAAVKVITERELEKSRSISQRKIDDNYKAVRNTPAKPSESPDQLIKTTSEPDSDVEPSELKTGWLARQIPLLKIIAVLIVSVAAFIFIGKIVSSVAPRSIAVLIKVALFAAITVYLIKGYAEKVSDAFEIIKKGGDTAQKAIDKRSEKIEKQLE
ncbi:MAG: hypothetical protein PHN84_08150 [Desulfuromonadaceae bacterium]|nr:hypothetical protein [Desulfuromonadaceae bacterium]MDD2856043.1 hypothetical protein [Desulfuromonadaceae bacterium]